jgi:uncharacterized glyoxalase superfamily protein PhnB
MPARVAPELFVRRAGTAVEFYAQAFGAVVDHRVGERDDTRWRPAPRRSAREG